MLVLTFALIHLIPYLIELRKAAARAAMIPLIWRDTDGELYTIVKCSAEGHWNLHAPWGGTSQITTNTGWFATEDAERNGQEPGNFWVNKVAIENQHRTRLLLDGLSPESFVTSGDEPTNDIPDIWNFGSIWIACSSDPEAIAGVYSYLPTLPSDNRLTACSYLTDMVEMIGEHQGFRDGCGGPDGTVHSQYRRSVFAFNGRDTIDTLDVFAFIQCNTSNPVWIIDSLEIRRGVAKPNIIGK